MLLSAPESRDQPQDQAQPHAQEKAGNDRKVKRAVLALMHNVSRQSPHSKWQLAPKAKEGTQQYKQSPKRQKNAPQLTKRIHVSKCNSDCPGACPGMVV